MDDLLSASRASRVALARQVAMYLSRELTDATLPAIGRAFGNRNHTTVMHACRRTAERIADRPRGLRGCAAGSPASSAASDAVRLRLTDFDSSSTGVPSRPAQRGSRGLCTP